MKLFRKYSLIVLMGLTLAGGGMLSSCTDDKDDFSTDQYVGDIRLNVWGPSPVMRGGELRFLGTGMDKVSAITLPGSGRITDLRLVSNEEVRITVPQNAEEGYLTVHTANGDIMAKTLLTFLEPITVTEITPTTVKPGETITVTGDYLNNIHEVIFSADKTNADAAVAEEDFIRYSRTEIAVVVPAEAKSGAIILSDAAEEMPNWIICDEEITVVTPTVNEVQNFETINPGEVITVKGDNLDLVISIVMSNGEEIAYTYSEDGTITFVVPDNACNGPICLVTASGVEVVAVNIGACQPEDLVATPAEGLRGGDAVAITGKNLQMVSEIALPVASGTATVDFTLESNEKIAFVFPADGQSGDVVMTLKGGGQVSVALATAKPKVLTTDQLPAGATVTLIGKNLDLLTSVTFAGGAEAAVTSSAADQATLTVPVTAQSGKATLNMANGESSEWTANIAEPTGAYIITGPTEEDEVKAGEIAVFTIGNPDKLSGVLVNNESVQYILNGSSLYVNLPGSCGKNTKIVLVSADGSQLEYSYDFIPATQVSLTIWSGMEDLGSWSNNFAISKSAFADVPAGAILTFHISAYSGFQIQVNNCNWSQITILSEWENWADMTEISMELTADILNNLLTTEDGWSDNAMIIQGEKVIISSITVAWENSLEETIWQGEWTNSGWGGNQDLAWGGFDWSSVKPGSVLRAYCTPLDASAWWCISFRHGDGWGNLPGDVGAQIDTPEDGVASIVLSKEILDDLVDKGGLVITGDGYTLTKVTIE